MLVGSVLLDWLAVDIAIIDYSNDPPLQPTYPMLGAVIILVGLVWTWSEARARPSGN